MLIIEFFLWRTGSKYAISNHYTPHCVWEEVHQNKCLNKYNHTVIDEQFNFNQSDGLSKFDPSDRNTPLPSYVPEGSFIVRAHTLMSNLFSCLWFNEVNRFTSCDQLSFAYTFLKLKRLNPDRSFFLNMLKVNEQKSMRGMYDIIYVCPETILRLIKPLQSLVESRRIALHSSADSIRDISLNHTIRSVYSDLISLLVNLSI